MSKLKVKNKISNKDTQTSSFYFALKSKNEIYFQMASIFKEITNDGEELTKELFDGILIEDSSKLFLENSFKMAYKEINAQF